MKRMGLFVLVLLGAFIFLPVGVFAEDEGAGEYVSGLAQSSKPNVALGHYGMMAKYADEFLSTGAGGHRTIYAKDLMDGVDKEDAADELADFFILDIRTSTDFCKAHIAGAVNIPFLTVAKPESLIQLPTDKPILVVCYTGHTASQTNAILNMLGYNAWTLRFGMTSWVASSGQKVWSSSSPQTIYGGGYSTEACTQ